jgi:hypothetical protein
MTFERAPRLNLVATVAVIAAWLTVGLAFAQAPPAAPPAQGNPPGAGAGAPPPPPRYDKKTETTVKGPIDEVKLIDTPSGVQGTHLMIKQGKETIEVFVGPTAFLERQKFPLAKGDAVEVTGSRVTINGIPALLARQIRKADTILILRDETGRPVWAPKP